MIKAIKTYLKLMTKTYLKVLKYIVKSIRFITPYFLILMYNYLPLWLLLIIPAIVWIVTSIIGIYLNQKNLGNNMPIPDERFTINAGDGEVTIDRGRLQELILYVYELEEWLKEKGL